MTIPEIIKTIETLELDHEPHSWPAVRMDFLIAAKEKLQEIYPPRFVMGDNKRFHTRVYGSERGQTFEVYGQGLDQWCDCLDENRAKVIAESLENYFDAN